MLDIQEYPIEQEDLMLMGCNNKSNRSVFMVLLVCTWLGSKHVVTVLALFNTKTSKC